MRMLIQLILSVSLPISIGVSLVFILYYKSVYDNLKDWEDLSSVYLKTNQMQILHNSVYVDKLVSQIHLQKISNDLIVYQGLYYKFINKQIKQKNENRQHKNCSYPFLNHDKCPQYIYDAFAADGLYSLKLDLFFHRTNFTYDSFQPEFQFRLRQNWDFYFFAKSTVYSRRNDLINISIVYNTFNDSLLTIIPGQLTNLSSVSYLNCMGNQFTEPYDPRCREWYQNALQHPGNQFFKPYQDFFTHTTIMTASARIDDPQGNNISIISVDFIIANLINNFFARQDQSSNFDTHSVLFHQDQNTVYYHRNWDANDRTIVPWQNLEFNEGYDENEYSHFVRQVQNSKDYSLTGQFDIESYVNVTQFFQFWTKNQKPYMSLIYPLQIISPQNVWNKTMITKQVLMVAKVREDISGIFKVINLTHDTNYAVILFVQATVVLLIILILTLHYAAILQYQVEIPLQKLTIFINQNTDQFRYQFYTQKQQQKTQQTEGTSKNFNFDLKKQSKRKITNQGNQSLKIDKSPQTKFLISTHFQLLQKKNYEEAKFDLFRSNQGQDGQDTLFKFNQEELQKQESNYEKCNSIYLQNRIEKEQSLVRNERCGEQISYQNIQSDFKTQMVETSQNVRQKSKYQIDKLDFELSKGQNICQKNEQHQKVNLQEDLDPMFLEMQIIKDTFYQLQSVISFKQSDIQQYSQISNIIECLDEGRCILHYSFAYKLFRQLKNNFGVALSSLNLGYFCYKKKDFAEALIYYESAMIHCIIDMGFSNIHEFISYWKQGIIKLNKSEAFIQKITIICTSLILSSHTIKEIIQNKNDFIKNKEIIKIFLQDCQMQQSWLSLAIFYTEVVVEIAQQLVRLNQIILSDEILLTVESNYIELIHEFTRVEEIQKLIQILEQKIDQKTSQELQYQAFQTNIPTKKAISPFNKLNKLAEQKNILPKYEVLNEFEEINEKLLLILKGKVEYFKGVIEQKKNNFKNACIHYFSCLEQHYYLEKYIQQKIINSITEIFMQNNLSIGQIIDQISTINQRQTKKVYDIAIIFEASLGISFEFQTTLKKYLQNMYFEFIRNQDRVTFVAFQNKNSSTIQPLLPINKFKQWKFCVDEIPKFSRLLTDDQFINFNKSQSNEKSLYFIFTSSATTILNQEQAFQKIIQSIGSQANQQQQIIHLQLQNDLSYKIDQQILQDIQQDQSILILTKLEHLQYYIDFHKRSDNSLYYLTNFILSSSNL
ncbi:hypothetical protein ABPG74_017908 [Tetrahymena malaccensis]